MIYKHSSSTHTHRLICARTHTRALEREKKMFRIKFESSQLTIKYVSKWRRFTLARIIKCIRFHIPLHQIKTVPVCNRLCRKSETTCRNSDIHTCERWWERKYTHKKKLKRKLEFVLKWKLKPIISLEKWWNSSSSASSHIEVQLHPVIHSWCGVQEWIVSYDETRRAKCVYAIPIAVKTIKQ